VALGAGLLLFFLVAWLERAMGTDLATAVVLEEACKFLILLGFAILAPRVCPRRKKPSPSLPQAVEGLIWGLAAIVVFATAENLAYFAAFPGNGIFLRLFWSEPVHLVSALAEAGAIWYLMRMGRGSGGTTGREARASRAEDAASQPGASMDLVARALCLLAIAVAWHLAFNLAADGPIQALEQSGDEAGLAWRSAILAAFFANLAALAALGYHFAHRVIVGGFLYGPE
jgi:RsiW-degrading membrane proteinase PrsW (M82 family)